MPYPDKVLADDEEVVQHLHPHAMTVFWPIVRFLVLVGAASFAAAVVPAGPRQALLRLVILAVAALLTAALVLAPLLRWRCTHYVITSSRVLFRTGVLARHGREIALARIADVAYEQSFWERLIRSGTVTIESAGEGGATRLAHVPDSEGVQRLLNHMVDEDADRRAWHSAGYLREGEAASPAFRS